MARLGDLCCFINGDRGKNYPSQAEISVNGEIPFINAGHIVDGKLDFSEMNYISQKKFEQLNSGKIQENDILYCLRGSLGKKAIVKGIPMGAIASSLVIIRPDAQKLNSDYLFYALESPTVQEQMMQANNGSSQPNLSAKSVSDYTFSLPGTKEQLVIVSKLDKVNELIALRKEQLAKLDQLVKSRFIELFGDPVANENKRKLSELGRIFTGNTPSMKETSYYESNDIPFIKPSDLKEIGVTSIEGVEAYVSEKARPVARIIPPSSILVTCIGTIGKIGIATRESTCNQQINFIVPNDNINSIYLAYCLTFFKTILLNMANAPVVPIINKTQFSELEIPVYSIEQQYRFATFVEQTNKTKLTIQASLDKLEVMKKAMMQEYFG